MSCPPQRHRHVMVDVEGMGDALLSIGAVPFSIHPERLELDDEARWFNERATLQANLDVGLELDPETMEWWLRQPKEAQEELLREPRHNTVAALVAAWGDWLERSSTIASPSKLTIWAKPPGYDCAMIARACKVTAVKPKVHFYTCTRDVRTLLGIAKELNLDHVFEVEATVKHDPAADAACQALQVIAIYRHLFNLQRS